MESQFVYGTYKSYKAGTEKVLRWLHENAMKCADNSGSADVKEATQKKGQGKKGSGKAKSKKADPARAQAEVVPVREFVLHAEVIASSEIKVPRWVFSIIDEVISARKKSARWFSQQAGDTTSRDFEESNAGHQYFIGILEQILDVLGRCKKTGKETFAKPDGDDPTTHITNLFEMLELEDVEEDTKSIPTEKRPNAPAPKAATIKVDYEDDEPNSGEVAWVIYCFFEDFNIAREHLKDTWTTYKHGYIDLTAAALATNTALVMFQRAETELMAELRSIIPTEFESQVSGCKVLQFLFIFASLQRGQEPYKELHPGDPYNLQLWDIADWICLPVYTLLDSFLPVIQPDGAPLCTPGYFGKLNLSEDVLDPRQKFTQDKIVLLERLMPEFVMLARLLNPNSRKPVEIPGQDELTKGVLKMIKTKEIPLWLVLGLQVQLDIHYMLLSDTPRPFVELSVFATKTADTVKQYLESSKGMEVGTWPKNNDRSLERLVYECEMWVGKDFLDPIRTELYRTAGETKQGGTYVLLKRHPLLCGMLLFRLTIIKHYFGVTLANAWGALPSVLHLYNAAAIQNTLDKPWMDMEALIIANSAERIFIGGRPDKPQEYFKRFLLVMGLSATALAANQRSRSGMKLSKKGPRQMLASPAIATIYSQRYINNEKEPHSELTLSAVEQLLRESAQDPGDVQSSIYGSGEESQIGLVGLKFKIKGAGSGQKGLPQKFAKSHKLTGVQLLTALETCIVNEGFRLNVDYFSLHMRSFEFLRVIHTALDASFKKYIGPMYLEKESQLPFLVGYVLQVVAGSSKAGAIMMNVGEEQSGSKILIEAGKLMSKFIEDGPHKGSEEIEKVKKICRLFDGIEPA